jgi:aryl-alcohol dehydrogenase-like predicted oxidoreductase
VAGARVRERRKKLAAPVGSRNTIRDAETANVNRHGEAFDVGETFSGVDYDIALEAVEEMRPLLPAGVSMSQFALRWILMFDAVTCAIPGGKRAEQVAQNCGASGLPPLTKDAMSGVKRIYDQKIRPLVHHRW